MSEPAKDFEAVVDWLHRDIVVARQAPGLLVGLSGTDSIVTYLACYEALKKAGKPERLHGVHFAPSDDFLEDYPEAEVHLWFAEQSIPWIKAKAAKASLSVERDGDIDWRSDGQRWGALIDLTILDWVRQPRPPDQQYWLVGTRNRSEDVLLHYSNASTIASVQPIINLWKSDILDICEWLEVPRITISKSCEVDCICGRERFPANYPRELDALLKVYEGELSAKDGDLDHINPALQRQLDAYVEAQHIKNGFKLDIPYRPDR